MAGLWHFPSYDTTIGPSLDKRGDVDCATSRMHPFLGCIKLSIIQKRSGFITVESLVVDRMICSEGIVRVELGWRILVFPVVGFVEVVLDEDYVLMCQKVVRDVRVSP